MAALYRHHGMALVRTTTDPGELALPTDLDLSDPAAVGGVGLEWLAQTWARAEVREAVSLASADLAERVTHLLAAHGDTSARDMRRVIMSLASYVLRWQRRATPFGLFSGIVPASVGPVSAYESRCRGKYT